MPVRKLGLVEGDTANATFRRDRTQLQFDFPKELREVLNTDVKAKAVFEQLTPGGKRSLCYLVSQVKSIDKRVERSLKIADRLKIGKTSARDILK